MEFTARFLDFQIHSRESPKLECSLGWEIYQRLGEKHFLAWLENKNPPPAPEPAAGFLFIFTVQTTLHLDH